MDLFGEPDPVPSAEPEPGAQNIFEEPLEGDEEPEGFQLPRSSSLLIGHEDIEARLITTFGSGRMPHGLIFAGLEGIGKATAAYRLSRYVLKYGTVNDSAQDSMFGDAAPAVMPEHMDIERTDPVFTRVASGGHPDFLSIERAYDEAKGKRKASVDVAQVRKVTPFLRMTASEGGWRVVIVDDADTMNRNAQNALLKILEEPPENTLLILVAHRPGALIPTIRSRTQTIHFDPLGDESMNALLEGQGTDKEALKALAGGSVGAALTYMENEALPLLEEILALFERYPSWPWAEIHKLSESLGRAGAETRYESFVSLLLWVMRHLTFVKARGHALSVPLDKGAFERLLAQTSLEQFAQICEKLDAHFRRTSGANLDKRQAVLESFEIIGH